MTMKRTGDAWMPADDYGRAMPRFSVNLLVRDVVRSRRFYEQVLGATAHYGDHDFVAMELNGVSFMLHADHTYDHHPLFTRLQREGKRGDGTELRLMGIDPDELEKRARAAGATIIQPAADFPHGWRDVILEDPDGYIWAIGVPLQK